jgi:hypothetical protein
MATTMAMAMAGRRELLRAHQTTPTAPTVINMP